MGQDTKLRKTNKGVEGVCFFACRMKKRGPHRRSPEAEGVFGMNGGEEIES